MMQTPSNQLGAALLREVLLCGHMVKQTIWMTRVVVIVLLLSAGVQAAYKPVDISDITGEQRKAWAELTAEMRRMSPVTRDCFICEQLGLTFSKDYSQVLSIQEGHPATENLEKAYFVGRGGKPILWWDAVNEARARWHKCYYATRAFKAEAPLVPFKKEVQRVALNTARYLLKTMPKEHCWMILASMGDMLYNDKGTYNRGRDNWRMEDGIIAKAPVEEGKGYKFLDPEGREHEIQELLKGPTVDLWRWRQVVWRCENLVGAKDILALFSEEVKAMREHHKERVSKVKEEGKEKNEALLVAADEMMSSLPEDKRFARIALAMGLYYLDHKNAGFGDGHLNPDTTLILPDGAKHKGAEFADEKPDLLQQVPHEAILEHYKDTVAQVARKIAGERFKEMPPMLRDLLRAQLSGKLIKIDGTPAEVKEGTSPVQTFDRTWQVPVDVVDAASAYFKNSSEKTIPCSIYNAYAGEYAQTINLVNLCARILGKEETAKLIPPGVEK